MWNELYSREANTHLEYECWLLLYCVIYAPQSKKCRSICPNNITNLCTTIPVDKCSGHEELLFPAYPVLEGHIRFAYSTRLLVYSYGGISGYEWSLPTYACFDETRSPFSYYTTFIDGFSCIGSEFFSMSDYLQIKHIAELAILSRASLVIIGARGNASYCHHLSLFHCPHTTKCISRHRLLDGYPDCEDSIDEISYNESCAIQDHFRFRCKSDGKCLSPLLLLNGESQCSGGEDEDEDIIITRNIVRKGFSFQQLCNGYQHIEPVLIDGQYNETDETHCEEWPCDNIYTRCDGAWSCVNGADERDCNESPCSSNQHFCLSAKNHTLMCLPYDLVSNGVVDCIGASDERQYCRERGYPLNERYQCLNTMECIDSRFICYDPAGGYYCSHDRKLQCSSGIVLKILSRLSDTPLRELKYMHFHLRSSSIHALSAVMPEKHIQQSSPQGKSLHRINYRRAWLCNRGILVYVGIEKEEHCLCPPSYYGHRCQFQSQRISLTLQFERVCAPDCRGVFAVIINLLDNDDHLHSQEQIMYSSTRDCIHKFNVYLLYGSRPKNSSKRYYVQVDVYNRIDYTHYTSKILPIMFIFLPVNRIAARLIVPASPSRSCTRSCGSHGHCTRVTNGTSELFFCRCDPGWSGTDCTIPYSCNCSPDAICVSSSTCICPLYKRGARCYLSSACRSNPCKNGAMCIPNNEQLYEDRFTCVCGDGFSGDQCDVIDTRIDISFTSNIAIPQVILGHFITVQQNNNPTNVTVVHRIPFDREFATLYTNLPFHLLFVQIDTYFYLALIQETYIPSTHIISQLAPSHRCPHVKELQIVVEGYSLLRRVKYYHVPCRQRTDLMCFYDNQVEFMCICTRDRQTNCFDYNFNQTHHCRQDLNGCENGGKCYQKGACPAFVVCMCPECYYGAKCQFSTDTKTFSLDVILGYHIRRGIGIAQQPVPVKVSIIVTTLIMFFGLISGILSILTFRIRATRELGCGNYLLAYSAVSTMTMPAFAYKVMTLLLSQMALITNQRALRLNCVLTDFMIQSLLTIGDWLAAAVAIERALSAISGAHLRKKKTKEVAYRVIPMIFLITFTSLIHDPFHRELVYDSQEERMWCLVRYSSILDLYNSVTTISHFVLPFSINCISAMIIIATVARHRLAAQKKKSYKDHLIEQFYRHKHLLISPLILIILATPRLVLTFVSGCMKSGREPWLFLMVYFISFIPPLLTFMVFVHSSNVYKKEFIDVIKQRSATIRIWFL